MTPELVVSGVFALTTAWALWEVVGLQPLMKARHARMQWRRPSAAMGVWQVNIGLVLAVWQVNQGEGWGAAVSGSFANILLGLLFIGYAVLLPRWNRMWEMHDSPTPGKV